MAKLEVVRNAAVSSQESETDGSGVVPSGASDRAQVLSGAISREQFLDLQVDRATAHLVGQLGAAQLDAMRSFLRAQLEQDPVLQSLTERALATG